MQLTNLQMLIIILAISLGTVITRFLPFALFPENKKTPEIVACIGNVLPATMMGLLVVYCLKGVSLTRGLHGMPELAAIAIIIFLHKWKDNVLLSIIGGTTVYMFLIQVVFSNS